jgi:hypothetical protein
VTYEEQWVQSSINHLSTSTSILLKLLILPTVNHRSVAVTEDGTSKICVHEPTTSLPDDMDQEDHHNVGLQLSTDAAGVGNISLLPVATKA